MRKNFHVYAATFLVAFSTLSIEITYSRLLSVMTFYHLAFFAVSTAMLGMTAGAVMVYLKKQWFSEDKLYINTARSSLGFAVSVPISVLILCIIPLSADFSLMKVMALFMTTIALSLPFFFSGIVLTVVLTKFPIPINKLYASDLIGAAFGCLFVLLGLDYFDAPSLIILSAIPSVFAALLFAGKQEKTFPYRKSYVLLLVLVLISSINFFTISGIRPLVVKGRFEDGKNYIVEKWNSHSRVSVGKGGEGGPQYWGPSPVAPKDEKILQFQMTIDGEAGTVMRKFSTIRDIEHLKYDVTNIGYFLGKKGNACIIGVGGGKDIQSAVLFGHENITGIDINPILINLLKNKFKDIAGVADKPGINLVIDEARSYLSRTDERFSVIQMSLIDTWASTGAGAYSLSENGLYTVEAWTIFLNRLNEDGIFTLSRWYNPNNLGETGRVVSLAVSCLLKAGVSDPSKHIAMVSINNISTLIISKKPFSDDDIAKLKKASSELEFHLTISPGTPPDNEILRKIISSKSQDELHNSIADQPLNYEPPTDENPYFFNMLKLSNMGNIVGLEEGILRGNLIASITLVILIGCLSVLTIITIIVPLLSHSHAESIKNLSRKAFRSGAFYFLMIGAGFMLTEIALIQKLSVFLGHPVYALGILLFTMILSSGIGSFLGSKIPLTKKPGVYIYPLIASAGILILSIVLSMIINSMITSPMFYKIIVSILIIFPMGVILGVFFPTGMKLLKDLVSDETPWYWALNGICGVLCSALAVFISIYIGISVNFYIASLCYGLLSLVNHIIYKERKNAGLN